MICPKLTDGERLVWAAVYARAYDDYRCDGSPLVKAARLAAGNAFAAVCHMRAAFSDARTEMDGADECTQMLEQMLEGQR